MDPAAEVPLSHDLSVAAIRLEARQIALQFAFAMAQDVDVTLAQTLEHATTIENWLTQGMNLDQH
jgi:hypothetical protein